MADYKVDSIADVRVADDPSSVRVAVMAGAEQVVLTIDWHMASVSVRPATPGAISATARDSSSNAADVRRTFTTKPAAAKQR